MAAVRPVVVAATARPTVGVMSDTVLTEQRGRVLLITLNRPEARNAIDTDLSQGVLAAVRQLDEDDGLSVGVLTGAGRGFSSGMDLKAFVATGPPVGLAEFFRNGARKPLIAAVEGFALAGGLELALACDLLVAAGDAKFGIPEASVGLFAGGGAAFRLATRVGYGMAMEMALTADPISAEQALARGLVNRLAEPGAAVEVAMLLAERIARNAPLSVAISKRVVRESQGMTEAEAWELQGPLLGEVFRSADAREGATAFAEKRAPNWTGR